MRRYSYHKPQTIEDALRLKNEKTGAVYIAGGTDVMVQIKDRELRPSAMISLRNIPDLARIEVNGGARIGALTTIADIIRHPTLGQAFPVLMEAARRIGSVQIRNVATIGGNLCNCSPCADMALPLLVLEAKVRLRSSDTTREVSIEDFFQGPGESCLLADEIMTDILLDRSDENAVAVFMKKGRVQMDLAVASVAALLDMEGDLCRKARIAAGSVAPVPLRLRAVEEKLEGSILSEKMIRKAQELSKNSVSPITDIRSTEDYRRQVVSVFVKRSLEKALTWSQQ
ncbi:MAG: xanthine dehydrogenase family protein subunit M [Candidatus Aminicenantaceae bacterium]